MVNFQRLATWCIVWGWCHIYITDPCYSFKRFNRTYETQIIWHHFKVLWHGFRANLPWSIPNHSVGDYMKVVGILETFQLSLFWGTGILSLRRFCLQNEHGQWSWNSYVLSRKFDTSTSSVMVVHWRVLSPYTGPMLHFCEREPYCGAYLCVFA